MHTTAKTRHLHFLDSIRIIAMLIVFSFHCGRFFDAEDWHVKNAVHSDFATGFVMTLAMWIMPLFFVISGAATWFALKGNSSGTFIGKRIKRIFIPLIMGVFIIAFPQVYLERLSHGDFKGSLIEFIPQYFNGWYGFGGNFAWMGLHLWYLLHLFVFSILALPLFTLLKKYLSDSNATINKIIAHPASLLFFPLISFVPGWLLNPATLPGLRVWGGWNMVEHLLFFISGYVLFSNKTAIGHLKRFRVIALLIALCFTTILLYWNFLGVKSSFGSGFFAIKMMMRNISCWGWMIAATGFAQQYLNFTNAKWKYAGEAVLPFYILHQTIIIIIGYFIVQWNVPMLIKYMAIAAVSFTIIMILYEFVIRRTGWLRLLFGMTAKRKATDLDPKIKVSMIHSSK